MKKLILFLLFLSSTYGFSQNLNLIKKEVEKINNSKNLKIKTVPNDYFVDVKNEVTDNGQELQGFYKNGELKKMIHEVILSSQKIIFEYYFQNKKLIFVKMKRFQIVDENGFLDKIILDFEGDFFFYNQKMIRRIIKGDIKEETFDYIKISNELKKDLKNYK